LIFLTVGSHEPFDRLVQGVDKWWASRGGGSGVLAQITERATYKPRNFPFVPALTPSVFTKTFSEASCVISHAGMGTIINALSTGKPIAVMPRRGHLHETRSDHQFATVQKLGSRAGVLVAQTEDDLPATLDRLVTSSSNGGKIARYADQQLIDAIRAIIHNRDE